jgi:hypothetical protein
MKMGMRLEMYQAPQLHLEQRLDLKQKIALKQLLQLRQELVSPPPFEACKGLEGLKLAHETLIAKNASGVLIGGVAEAIWNKNRKPHELDLHKDVDVLVLNNPENIEVSFEKEIDWWIPKTEQLIVKSEYSDSESTTNLTWWENVNGVVLSFGVTTPQQLPSGLYFPNQEWLVEMRFIEASVTLSGRDSIDSDVEEVFRKRMRNRMRKRLMPEVAKTFAGYVFDDEYEDSNPGLRVPVLQEFKREEMISINKHVKWN